MYCTYLLILSALSWSYLKLLSQLSAQWNVYLSGSDYDMFSTIYLCYFITFHVYIYTVFIYIDITITYHISCVRVYNTTSPHNPYSSFPEKTCFASENQAVTNLCSTEASFTRKSWMTFGTIWAATKTAVVWCIQGMKYYRVISSRKPLFHSSWTNQDVMVHVTSGSWCHCSLGHSQF